MRDNAWGRKRHKGTDVNTHKYSYVCSSSKLNNIDKNLFRIDGGNIFITDALNAQL